MAERLMRIGELARRTGLSPHVLRAWERRYAVLQPVRSGGNYRLYGPPDEARVRAMAAHMAAGVPAAEAARLVLEGGAAPVVAEGGRDFAAEAGALRRALDEFDDAGGQAALDSLLATFSFETVARDVLLPYLRDLGERWERGEASVAQEHFASVVLRGRLLGMARGWDLGGGERALLACPPGELHELGLILFGLALRRHGWRITYLGADTPLETLRAASGDLAPRAVVLTALDEVRFASLRDQLRGLAAVAPLFLAGAGATEEVAGATGAQLLRGDPVSAAAELAGAPRPALAAPAAESIT
jgi:DNA-binding transcriptional MerR regulator